MKQGWLGLVLSLLWSFGLGQKRYLVFYSWRHCVAFCMYTGLDGIVTIFILGIEKPKDGRMKILQYRVIVI